MTLPRDPLPASARRWLVRLYQTIDAAEDAGLHHALAGLLRNYSEELALQTSFWYTSATIAAEEARHEHG